MKMSMEHWWTLSQFNPLDEESEHWNKVKLKVKVKFTLEQATKALRGQ
jgi:hypothetical protein